MQKVFLSLVVLAAVLTGHAALAQPTPVLPTSQLAFDHDAIDTDTYELRVDAGAFGVVAVTPDGAGVFTLAMPALTPGAHELSVRACGPAGCSDPSNVLTVRLVVVPSPPGRLRVVPTGGGE